MIQVQVRIHAQQGKDMILETDILRREDATANERKIADAIEAMIVKVTHHAAKKMGAQLVEAVITGVEVDDE